MFLSHTTFRVRLGVALLWAFFAVSASAQPLTESAKQQIRELQQEKASRTPAQRKLDSQFIYQLKRNRREVFAPSATQFQPHVKYERDGRVLVDITGDISTNLLAQITAAGGEVTASVPQFRAVRAKLPLDQLEALAARSDVVTVRAAVQARCFTGTINSQGDTTHAAGLARTNFGVNGSGIKVGVLSDSSTYLANSQASGNLPANVFILSGQSGTNIAGATGEGTAMMEIIYDLAPGATLYFASAFNSEASFAQNILSLRSNGCDIIVDDVSYFDESPFQDSTVAQAVNTVTADGALYFSSAGNDGNVDNNTSATWEGDYVDGGAVSSPITGTDHYHDFGGGTNYNTILDSTGLSVALFWADPLGASTNDYDLYILSADGTSVVASSTGSQTGTQNPYELATSTAVNQRVVITKAANAAPRFIHVQALGNGVGRLSTATTGATLGHNCATNAFCVAAVRASTSYPNTFTGGAANPVEYFSSDGYRRMFFHANGTPITPGNFTSTGGQLRQKPDIAAADGTSTSVTGFTTFYGTSAAAPHAGAIAALLKSYNPTLTPAQYRTALTNTALDIQAAGFDRDSGVGIVMPVPAINSIAQQVLLTTNGYALTAESCPNGAVDPDETVTVSWALKNTGGGSTSSNLKVTLLATNGVTAPVTNVYGVIPGGGSVTQAFSCVVTGACGGSVTFNFQMQDGVTNYGTFTKTVPLGLVVLTTNSFTNNSSLNVPATGTSGKASVFPSSIAVTGLTNPVTKVTVTLSGLSHTFPDDLDIVLVGPSGTNCLIMSDAGGGGDLVGLTLTFDDVGTALPDSAQITSGTYAPSNYESTTDTFTSPGPTGPFGSALSVFNNLSPNGTWSLYLQDDASTDTGSLTNGWSISFQTATTNCCIAGGPTNHAPVLATLTNRTIVELTALSLTNTATDADTNTLTFSMLNAPTNATLNSATGVFSWTPLEAQGPSTNTLSIVVTDNGSPSLSATQTFTIFVLETNAAPALPAITNRTITELTTLTITNVATDGDLPANTLTFSLLNAPTNATVNSSSGVFAWTPSEAQGPSTNTLSIVVTDNGSPSLSATQTFTIFVLETNAAPALPAITNRTITELTTLTFTNVATDVDLPTNTLTFSLLNAPTNATLNSATGVFSWTPLEAQGPSTNTLSIVVTDNGSPSLSATQTFTIFVLETNAAPALPAITNRTITELTTLTFTNVATDVDLPTNTLTFSLLNAPTNANLSTSTGVFTWTPTEAQGPSTNTLSIVVTDNGSPSLSATQTFTIFVLETNAAPALPAITNRTITELTTLTITNVATDVDLPTNTLTFSLLNAPTNATLNSSSGVFTWTPSEAQGPSTNTLAIVVTDNGSPSLSATQTFTLFVLETNAAPALTSISNYTITELSTFTLTNLATDGDIPTNTLTFSLLNAPTNATINSTSGVFTWTPSEAQGPSTNTLSIVVTDNGSPSLSTTQTFTLFVLETNAAPALAAIPDQTIVELSTLNFTNLASDADLPTNTLTFSLLNAPTNAVLNTTNGSFTWAPTEAQGPSTNTLAIIVTDNGTPSLSTTQTFSIYVLETNSAPTLAAITNQTITELTALCFTNLASDGDLPADNLAYSLLGAPTNATVNPSNGVFLWTPTEAQGPSTNTFAIVVSDDGSPSLSTTQSFTIFVLESNTPPALAPVPDKTVTELATLTFTNSATDADLPANGLTFSLQHAPTNATLNPTNGVFTWTPTEAQGPSTNTFTIIVTDDGSPNLNATQNVTVIVLETNTAPALTAVADQIVHAGQTVLLTNSASDPDLPANSITFSLDPGAPTAATLDATNGTLVWATTLADANTTNLFTVRATDTGSPALGDTKSFLVIVAPRLTFTGAERSNEAVTLRWPAIAGRLYDLQFKPSLTDTNWQPAQSGIIALSNSAAALLSVSNLTGFYRVQLER